MALDCWLWANLLARMCVSGNHIRKRLASTWRTAAASVRSPVHLVATSRKVWQKLLFAFVCVIFFCIFGGKYQTRFVEQVQVLDPNSSSNSDLELASRQRSTFCLTSLLTAWHSME